ncbi:MAG: hypothetical protein ABW208_17655 [Pyrinomonadaceae bacterium]
MSKIVKLNTKFLSDAAEVGIEVVPPATDPDVVLALANDTSFPPRQIELGKISAKAEAGNDIKFGKGAGQVVFKGSASAFAGLGVYQDPAKLLQGLGVADDIAPGLSLANSGESIFTVLRWGYDVNASAKGSVALGAPGAVTFSGTGKREALYAVIRRFDKNAGALTAVTETAQSWMLPSQIGQLDDLKPGTWLIAEVDSSVALSLGVQYGYDFNWVREAKLLGLAGDIGLRLQMGVSAALNFNASGNFAVVISRDPRDAADQTLRFRLFRLRRKGWGFAFNAGVSVQGDFDDFLPEFDEFIKAVFGVHGAQVLKDLKAVEKWTNPDQSLAEILGEVGVDYGMKLLEEVTGIDPETAFDAARDRLVELVDKWNDLPHSVATQVWKLVEEHADLGEVRRIARLISEANEDTVRKPISDLLKDVDFFRTPAGAWLQAAAAHGILVALNSSEEFGRLQDAARKTLELLDPDTLEGALVRLQRFVEERLQLEKLFGLARLDELIGVSSLADLDQASFDKLDAWLKARLTAFIEDKLDLARINEIRQSIFLFIKRGRSFYEQTLKALNRKYEFNFAYTFQTTTTKSALLDFTLDFDEPQVIDALKLALGGDYDTLLVNRMAGVTLNAATLTHQIERNSHVEINLPWSKSAVDHINSSLAKVDAVEADEGRLLVYELDARDIVVEKNKRNSRLTVGGFLRAGASQVRVHGTGELTFSYSLRQVKRSMKRADLQYQLKPYVQSYFGEVFKPQPGGGGTFENWIGDLDNHIDALEFNGTDNFGDTLLGIDVSLPAVSVAAWLSAPPEPDGGPRVPQYLNMSRRIQRKMREIIPLAYFQDVDNYGDIGPASQLLVYSAIPPSTSARLDGNTFAINTNKDYYWDWPDEDIRDQMILHPDTTAALSVTLTRVHALLLEAGMTGTASFYEPGRAKLIQQEVARDDKSDSSNIARLFLVEAETIRAARRAGFALGKFAAVANSKPSEAVKELAKFGSTVTSTFNDKVRSIYGGGAVRPLGTALFIEAAAALSPELAARPTALLELIVLKQGATFQPADYLNGAAPDKEQVLVQERVVNVA